MIGERSTWDNDVAVTIVLPARQQVRQTALGRSNGWIRIRARLSLVSRTDESSGVRRGRNRSSTMWATAAPLASSMMSRLRLT